MRLLNKPSVYGLQSIKILIMKNNDYNAEQQNACCDTSDQNCCATNESPKKRSWKKISAILVLSLAMILAISAAANTGQETHTSQSTSSDCGLPSITDFDWIETDKKVAFVLLKGAEETSNTKVESKLETVHFELNESGGSAALFVLDEADKHFAEIKETCKVKSFPAIAILGRGCQSSVLAGDINSTRLIKAYILASTPASSCAKGGSSCCSKNED